MTRVKRGHNAQKRHHKKLKIIKGFRGSSLAIKTANPLKAANAAFLDRRLRKRFFRRIWISRINAKSRRLGLNYNAFTYKNRKINRKIFAQLMLYDPLILENFINSRIV